jgi:hypothetical protein
MPTVLLSLCLDVSMITNPIFFKITISMTQAGIYHELSLRSIAVSAPPRSHPFKIRNL